LPELLDQIPPDRALASVTADGAFDTRKCHDAIAARGAAAVARNEALRAMAITASRSFKPGRYIVPFLAIRDPSLSH
jgi:hypothetical protein